MIHSILLKTIQELESSMAHNVNFASSWNFTLVNLLFIKTTAVSCIYVMLLNSAIKLTLLFQTANTLITYNIIHTLSS